MIKWTSGATLVSEGDARNSIPGFIDLEKQEKDRYLLSFVSDINNRFLVYLTKKECEELAEKLKDITKKD